MAKVGLRGVHQTFFNRGANMKIRKQAWILSMAVLGTVAVPIAV